MTQNKLETGRWWEDAWWESGYILDHPVEKVRAAVHTLREFFPAEWVLKQIAAESHHPIINKLCYERGVMSAHFLVSVAEFYRHLSVAKGFPQKFADFTGEKHLPTWLEFRAASVLAGAGFSVEFPAEMEHKTPDIIAALDGETVAIECKRLEEERWEGLVSTLMSRLVFALPETFEGREIVAQITLEERLSEILMGESYDDINQAILEGVGARVQGAVSEALKSRHLPISIEITGIGKAAILPKEPGVFGSVSGMPVSRVAKLRRTLQNGLFRAVEQLQGGAPGIVVISSDFAPDPELARAAFDAITRTRRGVYRNILAMIILPRMGQSDLHSNMLLVNQNSALKDTRFRALDALKAGMGLLAI